MTTPTPTATVRKLGPGVLTVGSVGSPVDFSNRCTAAAVKWNKNSEDAVPLLDGSTAAGDTTYTATLEATVRQDDLVDGGLMRFSWDHKGEDHPATFTPYAGGVSITGVVTVDPLDVGGDVNKVNTAPLKWSFVGEPELVDDLG